MPNATSTTPPSTVILWCHPRSASTMFECMLLTKQDEFEVLHEPMGEAWYYGPERVSKRFSEEECEKEGHEDLTYEKAWKAVETPHPAKKVFSKGELLFFPSFQPVFPPAARLTSLSSWADMAQYLIDLALPPGTSAPSLSSTPTTPTNPTLIPTSLLLQPHIKHTFLIRHPSKAVPSYARLCFPGSETGFDYFDPKEMGYTELRRLFEFVKEQTGETPLLVEAEELLRNPVDVVETWCKEVGIEFHEDMLDWEDASHGHFDKWPGFHNDAINSKGVGKHAAKERAPSVSAGSSGTAAGGGAKKELSPELQQAVEGCMEDYKWLRQWARKV